MRLNASSITALLGAGLLSGAASFALASTASAQDDSSLNALRALAVNIEQQLERAERGQAPGTAEIASLQRTLDNLARTPIASGAATKHRAVARLLGRLRYEVADPARAMPGAPLARQAAGIDRETITPDRGGSCATALGISPQSPVQVGLAGPGTGVGAAWFHLGVDQADTIQFVTQSRGADPALEVFADCRDRTPLAANDDTLGLDASVSTTVARHAQLFVHLTNSGSSGTVALSVIQGSSNGVVSGTLKSAATNQPVFNATVELFDQQGGYHGSANTDFAGNYQISPFSSGTFYVFAQINGYVPMLYPNAQCAPGPYFSLQYCDAQHAQTVTLTAGVTVSGADISMSSGHSISGHVQDTNNNPLSASVSLTDKSGIGFLYTYTDQNGNYAFTTLADYDYGLVAASSDHTSQMFDHEACDGFLQNQCNFANADAASVAGADFANANFNLQQLSSIQGTIVDNVTSQPVYSLVTVFDSTGAIVAQANAYNGPYTVGPLGVGTFRLYVSAGAYFSQTFGGTDCATSDCSAEISASTPVVITQLGQSPTANFRLDPLPVTHGHVQDARSGLPLSGVVLSASLNPPASFQSSGSATTDQNGDYALSNLPAGQYYLWAISNDHVDQIYPGIACESFNDSFFYSPRATCSIGAAQLLKIAPAQAVAAHDFALTPSSRLSGSVLVNTGSPISHIPPANANVDIYDDTGTRVATVSTDAQGNYIVGDLPAGAYYAMAPSLNTGGSLYRQVWPNQNCGGNCVPTTGAAIALAQGSIANGVNFSLSQGDAIVGRVVDSAGVPAAGTFMDLFDTTAGAFHGTTVTDSLGFYLLRGDVNSNSFFVATEAGSAYVDQVYAGIDCPAGPVYYGLCSLTQATAVPVGYAAQPHVANFVLQHLDKIFADGFE